MENVFSSVLFFFSSVKQCEYVTIWVQITVRLGAKCTLNVNPALFFPVSREDRDSSIQYRSAECSTGQCRCSSCSSSSSSFRVPSQCRHSSSFRIQSQFRHNSSSRLSGQCSSWESCSSSRTTDSFRSESPSSVQDE